MRPSVPWGLAVVAGLGLTSTSVTAQVSPPVTVEIGAGVFTAQEDLGDAYPLIPSRPTHFSLGRLGAGPAIDASVLFRTPLAGVRPVLRLAYAASRTVPSSLRPCDPWMFCPDILIQPETRVSRLHALAGLELPLLGLAHGGDLHATFAAGWRRYGISWEEWAPIESSFILPSDGAGCWDPMVQAGLGVTVEVGGLALAGQWSVSFSDFGPGVRSGPDGTGGTGTIDLGRRSLTQHAVRVGVRKALYR